MKHFLIVFACVLLGGCTFHIKSKDLDIEAKPAGPGVTFSNATYELEKIDFLK